VADYSHVFGGNQRNVDLSLRDVVSPLFRKKKYVAITFLLVMISVIILGVVIPAPYKAQMSILVSRERVDPLVTPEATSQIPPNGASGVTLEEINSEAELLLSLDLMEKVVVATGMDKQTTWIDRLLSRTPSEKIEHEAKKLAKRIKVKNETNSNMINVSYSSSDPMQSYSVLNALANFYVEKHVQVHRAPGSSQFFSAETQKYYDALRRSEESLKGFSRAQNAAAPEVEKTDLALQVATTTGQLYSALQSAAADEQRIRADELQMKAMPERSTTQRASAPADKLLGELNATLVAAQAKRTQLVLKYDAAYPLVQEADQEIAEAKTAIAEAEKTRYITETTDRDATFESLREDLAKSQSDLSAQKATAAAARQGINAMQAEMVQLDQQSVTREDLLREVKANEDNYLLYLAKREQEVTTDALDKTRIGNVAIAMPPTIPALPIYSVPIVVLVAFGAAFVMSIGLAYTVDYFDSSLHTPAQVSDLLGIPVVVSMPRRTA
jgi:uncharacterized protein involved in exopolysaccharide biosynthesis